MNQEPTKLQKAKEILAARGLKAQDYKHLPYKEILKLAGVTDNG